MARQSTFNQIFSGIGKTVAVIGIAIVLLLNMSCGSDYGVNQEQPVSHNERSAEKFVPDPEQQQRRKDFIENNLIKYGIIKKVDGGSYPKVWVRSSFYAATFEQKETFMEVIYAYYWPDGGTFLDAIILKDEYTGKEVGSYNPQHGGLKMK